MIKKLFFFFILSIMLMSCLESISFSEAQPASKKDMVKFPQKLRGEYRAEKTNNFITISETQIVKWADIEVRTITDSLDIVIDSNKIISQSLDNIHLKDSNSELKIRYFSEDSALVNYLYRDTIFTISDDQLLRRFKGHYFLSYKRSTEKWKVELLSLERDSLMFSNIRTPEDISLLEELTEVEEIKSESGEVVDYQLKPTKKELKQLMDSSFSVTNSYVKVR